MKKRSKKHHDTERSKFRIMGIIIIVGVVTSIVVSCCSRDDSYFHREGFLLRNNQTEGDYEILLMAQTDEEKGYVRIPVSEKRYSDEEIKKICGCFLEELPELILGKNTTLSEVYDDLILKNQYEGYPFVVRWKSSSEERISAFGKVNRNKEEDIEFEAVTLTAHITLDEYAWDKELIAYVYLIENQRTYFERLEDHMKEINDETVYHSKILLPTVFEGKKLTWKEERKEGIIILFGSVILSCLIGVAFDRDQREKRKKEMEAMEEWYPDFVGKLRLLLLAGCSLRNAFFELEKIYGNHKKDKKNRVYKELHEACNKLRNGIPEEKVYEEWGRACIGNSYSRLSYLLNVQLKQGNQRFMDLLEEEKRTSEKRKRDFIKKQGEEAETKLLLPMMLMLLVVMVMLIVPVYVQFGGM